MKEAAILSAWFGGVVELIFDTMSSSADWVEESGGEIVVGEDSRVNPTFSLKSLMGQIYVLECVNRHWIYL